MGNCCCPQNALNSNAFQGEGHRLGSSTVSERQAITKNTAAKDDTLPSPRVDANLTDEERAKIRADRAAAAEARRGPAPKKTKSTTGEPLRGPNTKPTMTWTM